MQLANMFGRDFQRYHKPDFPIYVSILAVVKILFAFSEACEVK